MSSPEEKKQPWFKKLKRFDWITLGSILTISCLIGAMLAKGEQIPLQINNFSWEGKKIGVQDRIFTLKFNQSVDTDSVQNNLTIDPPLPGKIAWQGRNLIYTLEEPPIYGTNYQIKLQNAQRKYDKEAIQPFVSLFTTRDRVLAYIGIEGEERGRLVLYNITDVNQPKKTILTPRDLIVTDFKIYPNSDKILFSAFEKSSGNQGILKQELYTVTTGFNVSPSIAASQRAGRLERILDTQDYQNLSFDLSQNGKVIVVWRTNHKNPADSGLWVISDGENPRPLGVPGGEFMISPDGQRLTVSQKGGVGVVPLTPEAGASEFLAKYEKSLGFSRNGQQMLLVKDNQDYTRSLVIINQDGTTKNLLRTLYPIIDCEFEHREENTLYCLKTDIVEVEKGQYREEPFLSVINLKNGTDLPLLALPNYRDVQLSMSPDGVALLFDQVVTTAPQSDHDLLTSGKQAIADGRLWLLPLPELKGSEKSIKIQPEELTPGFKPKWLP